MSSYSIIDWNALILHEWKNSNWFGQEDLQTFWNSRAAHFEQIVNTPENAQYSELILNFIRSISGLSRQDTILDIGCGTGAIALPASQAAKKITCLDISSEMLSRLSNFKNERNIINLELIHESWMNAGPLKKHDIVISHRSLGVSAYLDSGIPDYRKCLEKMNRVARKFVFIIFPAFRLPVDQQFFDEFSDFDVLEQEGGIGIATFNLLYSLGYSPSFTHLFFEHEHTFLSFEDELNNYRHFPYFRRDLTSSRLKEYLSGHAVQTTEGYRMNTFKRIKAIHWKKNSL